MAWLAAAPDASFDPLAAADAIRAFLSQHGEFQALEAGRAVARCAGENAGYALLPEAGRLLLHIWTADANLVRRVVAVKQVSPRRCRLLCQRMGRTQPETLDIEPCEDAAPGTRVERENFLRACLGAARLDWREWQPACCAAGFRSPLLPMTFVRQHAVLAVLGVPAPGSVLPTHAMAQALLWATTVRRRWPQRALAGVRLILPAPAAGTWPTSEAEAIETLIALRQPHLIHEPAVTVYHLDRSAGRLSPAEPASAGNLRTQLRRAMVVPARGQGGVVANDALDCLALVRRHCPQATLEHLPNGAYVIRFLGLDVVRQADGPLGLAAPFSFGTGREQTPLLPATLPQLEEFLGQVARERVANGERRHPYFALAPERWMEYLLRSGIGAVDPGFDPRFVYTQVPFLGLGGRNCLDLLAADRNGRLQVLELKADEDLGLALQGLDYWRLVREHLAAGDFGRLGYFPGVTLSPLPPRLWLVSPALRWHPQADDVAAWIDPEVPWVRIGLNEQWRRRLEVVYRKECGS